MDLHVLLHHPDDSGVIISNVCTPLADRLERLIPELPLKPDLGRVGDWAETTRKFIAGLRLAASLGEDVEFS